MVIRLSRITSIIIHSQRHSTFASHSMALQRSTSRQIPGDMKIELTGVENQLCTFLDECCTDLKENKSISTSCRIAGGWVRDKLLGMQSNDIDIALTDMMGDDFAGHLSAFAESKNVKTGPIAIFNPNPEQSKHLQTARIPIFGLDLDLVNLRSEEYANNSRIPTAIAFGTPLQDALRRDITINALFYNIHTREVEDCTEKGIDDLKSGTIRTPLPPRETFLDDPLRILRSLRFATRFGFEIVPELAEAVQDPVIQDALVTKVKRERVGEEISKMMKGADPTRSIQMIDHLSLYESIFNVIPPEVKASLSASLAPSTSSVKAACILRSILHPSGSALENITPVHATLVSSVKDDPAATARLHLAAALIPHFGITYEDKKKKAQSAVECAIRESLKLGTQNHYVDGIPLLFEAAQLLQNPDLSQEKFKTPSERVALGLFLREKPLHHPSSGTRWQLSTLFSLVRELSLHYDLTTDKLDVPEAVKLIELYNTFVARVEELGLTNVGDEKPLLNGNTVCQILGASRSGAWTGAVLARVMEWQLQNTKATTEDCSAWLKEEQSAGRIDIDSEPANKRARTQR
ncbi:tRNA nucleotidyltransferase [Mycena venus]|uniref:tRNA nucleotidyltransferase n=1 Tax=Mycena venus TaxID=2733690 RepID=A0A8H7CL83_9AGAR|nr:tRNA nucleotidyltransferase [Mycena venus]